MNGLHVPATRPMGRAPDPLRPHAARVPLGSRRRVCRHRAGDPAGRRTGSCRDRPRSGERDQALDSPLAPKAPHFPAKAKACIVLFMYGGVSQVDTFDPKPELSQAQRQADPDARQRPAAQGAQSRACSWARRASSPGTARPGSRSPTCTRTSPAASTTWRSSAACTPTASPTARACSQMNTGFLRQGYPSLGSWVTYGLGTVNQNLPGYVVLLDQRGGPISGPPNWGSGFMPATYQGTQFRTSGDPILNLRPPAGISAAQQRNQLDLLAQAEPARTASPADNAELMARIASYELAFRMQAQAPGGRRPGERIGRDASGFTGSTTRRTERFGRRCLMARRLVERGVRFVQVYSGGGHNDENWDAHGDVNKNHELHCGETDQPIAALLTDLKRRGLLDETLVVWTGEFGRTPTGQNGKGRDHSPRGFTAWLAGGGVKGGQAYGATDDFGYAAVENKVHVHDLHATILHLLGFDHTLLTYFHGGRDMRLTDVEGRVVRELVA